MSISRLKELVDYCIWPLAVFRQKLARMQLVSWFLVGVAALVTILLLGGLFTLLPYADRQSIESVLRLVASSAATFLGFIIVALALFAGRGSDAREHLESVMPSYRDIEKFTKVRSDYRQALFSSSFSLDDQPMLGPYPRRCAYSHREIWAAIESVYRMSSFPLVGGPGTHDLVTALHLRGFSSREINRIIASPNIFERHPPEFFRALRKILQLEHAYLGESTAYLPSSGVLTELREQWERDRISASLDRLERHRRATGGRFWAAILSSIAALIGSVLLVLGSTEVTLQYTFVRMSFIGVIITWAIAIFLIIAYLTQLLYKNDRLQALLGEI